MLKLVINAIPIAPGGGLSALPELLEAWRRINAAIEPVVLVGKSVTLGLLRDAVPGMRVEPLLLDQAPSRQLLWQMARLGPWLRRLRPDALLTNNMYIPRAPCPQVVNHRNLLCFMHRRLRACYPRFDRWKLVVKAMLARRALTRADANIFITDYIRHQAEALIPASASRNITIYHGVYSECLEAGWTGAHLERDPYLLSAIQSLEPYKDNTTLLRTFAEIRRREPNQQWRLQIIGYGDWSRWQAFADHLGIGENIRFLGYLDRKGVIDALGRSACLLFTSRIEGFGRPVIEAMACGCPVVASNATAIPEVGGPAVVLACPGEPESFADKVLEIVRDPGRREALSKAGRLWSAKFSWDESARRFAECLQAVVRGGPLTSSPGALGRQPDGKGS